MREMSPMRRDGKHKRTHFVRCFNRILQLIGKHHLRQFTLAINRIGTLIFIPIYNPD